MESVRAAILWKIYGPCLINVLYVYTDEMAGVTHTLIINNRPPELALAQSDVEGGNVSFFLVRNFKITFPYLGGSGMVLQAFTN